MSSAVTILIVDDEPRNRELLEAILKPAGYTLAMAADGREALAQTLDLKPDLILLDVMMPDINGYEVCETIREDPELAEIPVIMVTALNDRESRLRGIEAGADDFLTKPVDGLELKARAKTITRLNRYRRLSAEREKFSRIADFAGDALLLLGNDDRIRYANERAGQFLQQATNTLSDRAFRALVEGGFMLQPPAAWEHWVDSAEPDENALRYLVRPESASGAAVWLQAHLFRLPATGDGDWLVRLQDVTGLMNQQRDMWNYHRMLSHKLRTPLNGLVGSLSILSDLVPAEDRSLAEDAVTSAARLEEQVKDVLRYLDAPKLARDGDHLKGSAIKARTEDLGSLFDPADLQVTVSEEVASATLGISSLAMDVVLAELFENTRKFHPEGKPRVTVTAEIADGGQCEICVTDNGQQLSPAALDHIGRPYFQGESKLTGEVEGMGLGLAMISSMVWQVGGNIAVENLHDGPGVSVKIRLPIVAE
jgi:two-component system, cell cycle response regulator